MKAQIIKILNNSALILSVENTTCIGLGNGIGFGKKNNDWIDLSCISKLFKSTDNQFLSKLSTSISKLNEKYYKLVEEIISFISSSLNCNVNDELYLLLAEHISFAEYRIEHHLIVPCPMQHEVKILYSEQYIVASQVVDMIERRLNKKFPESEIGLIALHILNATNPQYVLRNLEICDEIIKIIESHFQIQLDVNSIEYARLITHLKFLSNRILRNNCQFLDISKNIYFNETFKTAIQCVDKIITYLDDSHHYHLNNDEISYLIIHISNCIGGEKNGNKRI